MTSHAHITQNNKVAISLQYIKKEVSDKIGFSHVDKHRGAVKHSQSAQNIKFAMALQYLQKQVRDEVEFLHADKHQNFLQVYFTTLVVKVSY